MRRLGGLRVIRQPVAAIDFAKSNPIKQLVSVFSPSLVSAFQSFAHNSNANGQGKQGPRKYEFVCVRNTRSAR